MKGRSPSDVAWIGSLQLCLLFMTGLIVGKAFDEGYFQYVAVQTVWRSCLSTLLATS